MQHTVIIECHTYFSVAEKVLQYQGYRNLFLSETIENSISYLILSDAQLDFPFQISWLRNSTRPLIPLSANSTSSKNNHICFSLRIKQLSQKENSYKFLAETILNLPYLFTKAAHSIDPYGNELLILLN